MNTLAFVNFLLVKIFPTLIRQYFPPSKFYAIRYLCAQLIGFPHSIISDQYDLLKRRANYRIAQNFYLLF